jgi:hypothetical protein
MVTTRLVPADRRYSIALLVMLSLTACGGEPKRITAGPSAPNPNGCYAYIYDHDDFNGMNAVLNGPGRWQNLERVQVDNVDWRNRIRSIDVGAAATVTVFTEIGFTGTSRQLPSGSRLTRLDDVLSANIESVQMTCKAATP